MLGCWHFVKEDAITYFEDDRRHGNIEQTGKSGINAVAVLT
jgi:hypothetical protein